MKHSDSIDYLTQRICVKQGEKKALLNTNQRAVFRNNYIKGYLEAIDNELKFLIEFRKNLASEQHEILESCKKMVG